MIELIKKVKNVDLTGTSGKVTLGGNNSGGGSGVAGEAGGYYIPFVDEEGYLNWTPSKPSMPAIDPVYVKGEDG